MTSILINIYAPPASKTTPGVNSPFSGKGDNTPKNPDVLKALTESTKSAIEQNGSATIPYKGTVKESFTIEYSRDTIGDASGNGKHFIGDMHLSTSIDSDAESVVKVIPNANISLDLNVVSGDIIEIIVNSSVYYLGYVLSAQFDSSGSSCEYMIRIAQFKHRLGQIGYLSNLYSSGVTSKDQVKLNRAVANLIALCRINQYISCVPIYTDINNAAFFSFYQISDSIGATLKKLSNLFVRHFFQRRNGNIYITQLIGSDAVTRDFGMYDLGSLFGVYDTTVTKDYTNLPSKVYITYNNDLVVTKSLITATYEPTFEDYPNKDTLFDSVVSVIWDLPVSISTTTVIAYQQFTSITTPLFTYNINFSNKQGVINGDIAQTYTLLEIVRNAYSQLRTTNVFTVMMILTDDNLMIDIGDTIISDGVLYSVMEVTVSFLQATIYLKLIPTNYTNPIVTISQANSTYIDINNVVNS